MIVGMKKLTVIALADESVNAVARLQALGVLHLNQTSMSDASVEGQSVQVRQRLLNVERVIQFLSEGKLPAIVGQSGQTADEVAELAQSMVEKLDALERIADERQRVINTIDEFSEFGEFDPQRIQRLQERGIHVHLYRCNIELLPEIPDQVSMEVLLKTEREILFAAISDQSFTLATPKLTLPESSVSTLRKKAEALQKAYTEGLADLRSQQDALPEFVWAQGVLEDELALFQTQERMKSQGKLVWLEGYCPVTKLQKINREASVAGWGMIESEPAPNEQVPTLIENPRWLRPVEVVFGFIETYPGYREKDIGAPFFLFLILFYAMLIGDAGYGLVFLAGFSVAHWRLKDKMPKQFVRLFYIFNLATVVWGVLAGNYFGILLPEGHWLQSLVIIPSDQNSMMQICFTIGVIHLTVAHLWTLISVINSRKAIAEAGWLMTVWAAYFLAMKVIVGIEFPMVMAYVGGAGILLALIFSGSLFHVADLFQFPFAVINCFSDIASYLRLFAVGAAALALAKVFNGMGTGLMSDGGVLHIVGGVMILLLGHSLNLVLGLLSVLVHGLRLNLLEFSGHVGLEWAGFKYNPFRSNR